MSTVSVRTLVVLSTAMALPALGAVQPSDLGIELVPIATGLVSPIMATHAGDSRLFIVEQTGKVLIVQNGVLLATPFLDLSAVIPALNANFDERGLLGLAFHPNYASNGRFFVRYSVARAGVTGEPCFGTARGCHREVLAEYRRSAGDPNVADPAGTELFTVDKPQFNHDGGHVEFGPDGFLYFSLGDGGGANDGLADVPPSHGPIGNAQNIDVPLGKMLRIDVNGTPPYSIPASNPFVGRAGLDEIYAYGLRNPYRFSFDHGVGGDGRLWCADVGQNFAEEIDVIVSGGNYGWVLREGFHCFDPFNPNTPPATCNSTGLIDPISGYDRTENGVVVGISIIGGHVYRGTMVPQLVGKYVFGDYSTSFNVADGHLFYLDTASPAAIHRFRLGRNSRALGLYVKGFGRDSAGEVYVLASSARGPSGTDGRVYRLVQGACQADLDDGSGVGTPDGGVTIDDLVYFLSAFGAGTTAADLDDGSATGTPDLGVTIDDLIYYLTHFAGGC